MDKQLSSTVTAISLLFVELQYMLIYRELPLRFP